MCVTSITKLLPRVPESLCCPKFKRCSIARWPICTFEESAKCGLLPDKEDPAYIDRVLARSHYWSLPPLQKVAFIKSYFDVETDVSEVDYHQHIANIISARLILFRR